MGIPSEYEDPTSFRQPSGIQDQYIHERMGEAVGGVLTSWTETFLDWGEARGIPVRPDDPMDYAIGGGLVLTAAVLSKRMHWLIPIPDVLIASIGIVASNVAQQTRRTHVQQSGVRGSGSFGAAPSYHLEGGKPWWN